MRAGVTRPTWIFLAIALVAAAACRRAARDTLLDLAAAAGVADHEAPFDLVRFGVPGAEPRLARGFYVEPGAQGDRFGWARRRTRFRCAWNEVRPRTLVLDMAPYPGLTAQAVEVSLNGAPLQRFGLDPGRRRYRVDLPTEPQTVGDNIVGLQFADIAPADNPHRRRLSAAVYSAAIAVAPAPVLDALLARDAPPPLAVEDGSAPSLTQVGPSALRYAFLLPEAAEIRFVPKAHPLADRAGERAVMSVTVQTDGAPAAELWRGRAGEGGEVGVRLPGRAGTLVRLGLHVEGGTMAWATWVAPRVVGRRPPPSSPVDADRVAALRHSLKDASLLLVVLDAASARHFGAYGYPRDTTPEIDRLASEGVLFERAFTPAVYTLAAMSALWTSIPPDQLRRGLPVDAPLPAGPLTLAELLSANGVATGGFVANGFAGRSFGFDRGFGYFEEVYRAHGYRASAFLAAMPPWLAANRGRRFFAYAHFREPHFPYDPEPPFNTRFGPDAPLDLEQRRSKSWHVAVNERTATARPEEIAHLTRLYDGNLAYADHVFGRLRAEMERLGLWERTVVVVAADHGEALYEHGLIGHNHQVFEESTAIPLIVRFPGGHAPRGLRVRSTVGLLDVAPTVADVFALGARGAARGFQGRSLLPLAFSRDESGFVVSRTTGAQPRYALRDARYRYIFDSHYGQQSLFDLESDAAERENLVATRPVVTAFQRQRLHAWLLRTRGADDVEEGTAAAAADEETRENLRALGYIN
jgi:arylsulfatase A-like enzyme